MGQSDAQGRRTACRWRLQVKGASEPSAASFPLGSMVSEDRLGVGERAKQCDPGIPVQRSKKAVMCNEYEKYTDAKEKIETFGALAWAKLGDPEPVY